MQTETELRNLAERYNYKIAKSEDGELTLHYDWDEGNVLAEGLEDIEDFILGASFIMLCKTASSNWRRCGAT